MSADPQPEQVLAARAASLDANVDQACANAYRSGQNAYMLHIARESRRLEREFPPKEQSDHFGLFAAGLALVFVVVVIILEAADRHFLRRKRRARRR